MLHKVEIEKFLVEFHFIEFGKLDHKADKIRRIPVEGAIVPRTQYQWYILPALGFSCLLINYLVIWYSITDKLLTLISLWKVSMQLIMEVHAAENLKESIRISTSPNIWFEEKNDVWSTIGRNSNVYRM